MNENFTLRYANKSEINNWDANILKNRYNAGFLQSKAYAETKTSFGWEAQYVVYENAYEKIYSYFLSRKLPILGLLWYMPSGSLHLKYMESILQANKIFIQKHKLPVFLIKIEPKILNTPYAVQTLYDLKLRKTTPIQADTSTILLDLTANLPQSLGTKARRDIRLATRQSIEVRHLPFSEDTSQIMYELMKTVKRGEGSAFIRPYQYYRDFWYNFSKSNNGSFYFAYENDRPVVGAFVIYFGSSSIYKDGGSTPDTLYKNRYSMAVQWQVLQDAKQSGQTLYDLCGVPPRHEIHNSLHPYYGIGQFKLKFKKDITEYCGCYDQVLKPVYYQYWNKIQRIIYKAYLFGRNDLFF